MNKQADKYTHLSYKQTNKQTNDLYLEIGSNLKFTISRTRRKQFLNSEFLLGYLLQKQQRLMKIIHTVNTYMHINITYKSDIISVILYMLRNARFKDFFVYSVTPPPLYSRQYRLGSAPWTDGVIIGKQCHDIISSTLWLYSAINSSKPAHADLRGREQKVSSWFVM